MVCVQSVSELGRGVSASQPSTFWHGKMDQMKWGLLFALCTCNYIKKKQKTTNTSHLTGWIHVRVTTNNGVICFCFVFFLVAIVWLYFPPQSLYPSYKLKLYVMITVNEGLALGDRIWMLEASVFLVCSEPIQYISGNSSWVQHKIHSVQKQQQQQHM